MEIKNAVIESVTLEKGDRGFLQCWLHLSYGGSGQGFGGYVLYLPKSYSHHELKSFAGHFIFRCMEIAGVERWDQLQGRTIRVRSEHHTVHAIGHIVKDDWFDPSADFDPKPAKCDGNHGGQRCADPECWNDEPVALILEELRRAVSKFPTWPTDPLHAIAVLGEEFGELTKATLQTTYESHKSNRDDVRTEAIQTAAMALRFVISLDRYEYAHCTQHEQSERAA